MLQLAMNSKCPKSVVHSHYGSLLAGKNRVPPTRNSSATSNLNDNLPSKRYRMHGWQYNTCVCTSDDKKELKNLAGYSAVRSTDEWISFLDVSTLTLHSSDRTPEAPGRSQLTRVHGYSFPVT